jgi:hypothetical protein
VYALYTVQYNPAERGQIKINASRIRTVHLPNFVIWGISDFISILFSIDGVDLASGFTMLYPNYSAGPSI